MLLRTIKHFCETTSVHGLGFIVEAKSSPIKRIAWFVIFLVSISYAGIQLKENVDSKLTYEQDFCSRLEWSSKAAGRGPGDPVLLAGGAGTQTCWPFETRIQEAL